MNLHSVVRYREIGGGERGLVHQTPQTPPPGYPRTSKLVISHFLREAVRILATDTFDMAGADTC